jgi:hypothetical protein
MYYIVGCSINNSPWELAIAKKRIFKIFLQFSSPIHNFFCVQTLYIFVKIVIIKVSKS